MTEDDAAAKGLDEATGEVRRALLWFSSFAAYFAITVAATTHEQLLKGNVVKLPILNVDLPIVGFYVVGPTLFLALHAYLLFQLHQLSLHVRRMPQMPPASLGGAPVGPSFPVTQYLLGGLGRFRLGVGPLIWLAVIVLPIVVLIFAQIRFLPYHAARITLFHQMLLIGDVLLLVPMWCLTIRGLGTRSGRPGASFVPPSRSTLRLAGGGVGYATLFLVVVAALLFSVFVASIPKDRAPERTVRGQVKDGQLRDVEPCAVDRNELRSPASLLQVPAELADEGPPKTCSWGWPFGAVRPAPPFRGAPRREMPCLTYLLFEAPTTPLDMRRNLVVRRTSFAQAAPAGKDRTGGDFDLRGRDLRFADFTASDLSHADLRGADLFGARFDDAALPSADLGDLPEAEFDRCEGFAAYDGDGNRFCRTVAAAASLARTDLANARLYKADLRGAKLGDAELTGADLGEADLTGAELRGADLASANLAGAWLNDADLTEVRAVGANLDCARARAATLRAADLSRVGAGRIRLTGAQLQEARLVGSYLARADLAGANLAGAYLQGVDLRAARLTDVTWWTPKEGPAILDLVDQRGSITDYLRSPVPPPPESGARQGPEPPLDGAPDELESSAYLLYEDNLKAQLYHDGYPPGQKQLGVLNLIERAGSDNCAIPRHLTELAVRLLAGACERGDRFSAREWWLLQQARRAGNDQAHRASNAVISPGEVRPAAGAPERTASPGCAVGPPPSPESCKPQPWLPVDTPGKGGP